MTAAGPPVDDRGIPITAPDAIAAEHAPAEPCQLCTGTAANGEASWDWCRGVDTCAATVDWDKVFERRC